MDIFEQAAKQIIIEQEAIIGPIALEQAKKVSGLTIDWEKHSVTFKGNKTEILNNLVEQYKKLFGKTSVEVCKEAIRSLLPDFPKNQLPSLLA